MSTIKFVYRSQNIPDTVPTKDSEKTITSGAVYKAISEIQMDTLFATGYLPEGIAQLVPQHKLVLNGSLLTLESGSNVFIPNGKDEDGEFLFTKVTTTEDVSKEGTTSGNMDSFVFYNNAAVPTLVTNTKRHNETNSVTGDIKDSALQAVFAQVTRPAVPAAQSSIGAIWWDLNENYIKVFDADFEWKVAPYSIPLCFVHSSSNVITEIGADFLNSGVCCDAAWVNPGATYVIPQGRDEEKGIFKTKMLEVTDVICKPIFQDSQEAFEDYALYIDMDGEILGPISELAFDSQKGYFIDDENNNYEVCRFAYMSADHLTTASTDPLTCTDYSERSCLSLADSDDIEYVIKLIGSSMGITIDDLQAEIDAATHDRALIRQEIGVAAQDVYDRLYEDLNKLMVHKQLPEGYDESDVLATMHLDETIYGTKTFVKPIVGSITGSAQNVAIGQTTAEIIPTGLTSYSASGDNDLQSADTDVRIGTDYVKATKFNGTCTHAYWADLAEMYETDAEYEVGTLLRWGGEKELTLANFGVCNAVVSEKPAFLMNAEGNGQPIALAGRVKVRVMGPVKKHDAIVLNEMAPGVGKVQENVSEPIIARALEDNDFTGEKLVLCVVRFSL